VRASFATDPGDGAGPYPRGAGAAVAYLPFDLDCPTGPGDGSASYAHRRLGKRTQASTAMTPSASLTGLTGSSPISTSERDVGRGLVSISFSAALVRSLPYLDSFPLLERRFQLFVLQLVLALGVSQAEAKQSHGRAPPNRHSQGVSQARGHQTVRPDL
jgi:hypothetical protein